MKSLYRGFSCPQEKLDQSFISDIASQYARKVTERFLHRYFAILEENGDGLVELIQAWLSREIGFEAAWNPVFGTIGELLAGRTIVPAADVAARLGLEILFQGVPGQCLLFGSGDTGLRWGRWPIPTCKRLRVQSDGQTALLQDETGGWSQALTFTQSPNSRTWQGNDGFTYPQVAMQSHYVTLLTGDRARSMEFQFLADDAVPECTASEISENYNRCFRFIETYAPEYLSWVDQIMRYVIPLRGGEGRIVSGSTRGDSGVSHISSGSGIPELAEMLVHESSHHYYYLITRLQAVTDGSDESLYFSPIKQCGRPLHYIHLSFHAFANVVLLGRTVRARGYSDADGYFDRNEKELLPQLAQLEEALSKTRSLTEVGKQLWQPLSKRVRTICA
jgi:HEXXH motif-containing protein